MAFCTACGAGNPDGARFCGKCGAALAAAAPPPAPPAPYVQGPPAAPPSAGGQPALQGLAAPGPAAPAAAAAPGFDFKAFLDRLGLSGKILFFGAPAGIFTLFLPLVSMPALPTEFGQLAEALGGRAASFSSPGLIEGWQGILSLLGFVAVIVFCFLAFKPAGTPIPQNLAWALVGSAGGVALVALITVLQSLRGLGHMAIGFWLYLVFVGVVGYGAFLKAREERLF